MKRLALLLGVFAVALGCSQLTGPKPEAADCHGYPMELDTLTVFVGASGQVDSVTARWFAPAHICGLPYHLPPKPKPDTIRTP